MINLKFIFLYDIYYEYILNFLQFAICYKKYS